MGNNLEGGKKGFQTRQKKYGKDHHSKISSKGGKKTGVLKGFAWMKVHDPERLKEIRNKRYK